MDLLLRVVRYTKLHLIRDPKYFFTYALNYFNSSYVPDIKYYEPHEITNLLHEGKSIIRLGDGEIYMLNQGNLPAQVYVERLRELILESVKTYSDKSPYVMCLNRVPLAKTNKLLKFSELLTCWLPSKVYYELYFNKRTKYLDAAMFYVNDTIPKYFESYLLTKTIIIATNKRNIEKLEQNKNIPFKDLRYIEVPATNAFSVYDEVKKKVHNLAKEIGIQNSIFLVASGPSSKALAYELSQEGVQSIDVGYGIEVAYSDENHYLAQTSNL